jgi:pyroglutamyl-peptidase
MKIVIVGFNPFGGLDVNSSEALVRVLATSIKIHRTVKFITSILRTEYRYAGNEIARLIREIEPDVVVCTGMSSRNPFLQFEQVAQNWDCCSFADNVGDLRTGSPIIANGPPLYRATLPYYAWRSALDQQGIPSVLSEDAGGYVCNHVFYRACYEIDRWELKARCGLVHLPPIQKTGESHASQPLALTVQAIKICLTSMIREQCPEICWST